MRLKKRHAVLQLCLWAFAGTVVMCTGRTTRLTYGLLWAAHMLEFLGQLVIALIVEERIGRRIEK